MSNNKVEPSYKIFPKFRELPVGILILALFLILLPKPSHVHPLSTIEKNLQKWGSLTASLVYLHVHLGQIISHNYVNHTKSNSSSEEEEYDEEEGTLCWMGCI